MVTKQVLVTGASGFIGSHLTEELVRRGFSVRALVRYSSSGSCGWLADLPPEIFQEIDVHFGDIRDSGTVDRAVCGTEIVFNLAALIGIPYSYIAPSSYIDTNVVGALNVLEASRRHEVIKIVQTSTSEVYGTARYVPMDESHPLSAQSPYASSKIAADQLALAFFRSFGTPVTVLRPFNTFGPRQSLRALVPTIVCQLLAGGNEVRLGSFEPTRDLTFVRDTAAGFVACALAPVSLGQEINLGTGYEISVKDLCLMIAELMGRKVILKSDSGRIRPEQSEVNRLVSDNQRAQQMLSWEPENSGKEGLETGLMRTIEWFAQRPAQERLTWTEYHV